MIAWLYLDQVEMENGASYTLLDYMEGNLLRFLILIQLHPWS